MSLMVKLSGKHLIPWREKDYSRTMDRYDARLLLEDEKQFTVSKDKRKLKLSEKEQVEEKLCDEERYYDLFHQPSVQSSSPENSDDDEPKLRSGKLYFTVINTLENTL